MSNDQRAADCQVCRNLIERAGKAASHERIHAAIARVTSNEGTRNNLEILVELSTEIYRKAHADLKVHMGEEHPS